MNFSLYSPSGPGSWLYQRDGEAERLGKLIIADAADGPLNQRGQVTVQSSPCRPRDVIPALGGPGENCERTGELPAGGRGQGCAEKVSRVH